MRFDLNDEQRMLVEAARRFVGHHYSVESHRALREAPDGVLPARWAEMADLGWLALPVPAEAGGLGGTIEDIALLMIELGRGWAVDPLCSVVVAAQLLAARSPVFDTLLGDIAAGTARVAIAHLAPGGPAEDAPRPCVAHRQADGWRLSGDSHIVLDGPSSSAFIVSATLTDAAEQTLFVVPAERSGVSRRDYVLVDGSHACDLILVDVAVGDEDRIASGPAAQALAEEALDRGAIVTMAQMVGALEATLDVTADYLKQRRQFGQPLSSFQALQHTMAEMFASTHQARSILYHAISATYDGPAARRTAVAAAKVVIGEAAQFVSRRAVQLHGGYGVTDEYAVSHLYRRLFTLEKQYGDAIAQAIRFQATMPGPTP